MLDNFCLLTIINEETFLTFVNEVASLRKWEMIEVGCMMVGEVTEYLC
jgi:hypothetical protein